jgi:hypothetical protein
MKKALKVIAVIVGTLVLVVAVVLIVFIKNMPSSWQVKQALSPSAALNPKFEQPSSEEGVKTQTLPEKTKAEQKNAVSEEARFDEGKELSQKALREDFLNERQPLSSACAHLDRARDSRFLRADQGGSKEFLRRLTDTDKDPLVEAAAPVFRYVVRFPEVRALIDTVDRAQAENANDLLKKTEFYSQIALAAKDIRTHKTGIDQILMKSYNLYMLSKAVGKNPELARDPATLAFCEQIQKNINLNMPFNADQQAAELQKFLEYAKVTPQDIGYDASYRSNVSFEFKRDEFHMNNLWLEKLFADDVKKAEKELDRTLPKAPADGPAL